ncbi:MAG: hypothetical protein AABY32_03905 [Nanoarchaeota archaeon]
MRLDKAKKRQKRLRKETNIRRNNWSKEEKELMLKKKNKVVKEEVKCSCGHEHQGNECKDNQTEQKGENNA